ncbi:hypothetical protein LOTGIDRAFT_144293, partial [Lottia gigantea]
SHGSSNSAGTAILLCNNANVEILKCYPDPKGYYCIVTAHIFQTTYILVNTYSPIPDKDQFLYYQNLNNVIKTILDDHNYPILIGGDFNNVLNKEDDRLSGNYRIKKKGFKEIFNIINTYQLIDIYRFNMPMSKKYTWKQKKPSIHSRIDFWLVSEAVQERITNCKIIPNILSDHSTISINLTQNESKQGPSLRKFKNLTLH